MMDKNIINLKEIQSATTKCQSLKPMLEKVVELVTFFEQEMNCCNENYRKTINGVLQKFPLRFGVGPQIYSSYGGRLDLTEAADSLAQYIISLESFKYLSFLKDEKRNVVFIGPNGSGKSTLVRMLHDKLNSDDILFFPADRMLTIDTLASTVLTNYNSLIGKIKETYKGSISIESGSVYNTSKLFALYISLLKECCFDEYTKKEKGNASKVIEKWRDLIGSRELFFDHDLYAKPTGAPDSEKYDIKYLSSGEKSILFFLMGILLNEEKTYYFIDEPENNLNPSIVSEVWDYLQAERPNSIFVYLTHDSSFAASRINAKEYWIKKYDGKIWEYEPLPESELLPKKLLIELIGTKQPIVFCESEDKSKLDYLFFKKMFPEFNVVPSGGCDKVISNTKAYKRLKFIEKAYGIIDRDYKDSDYLSNLESDCVYHLPFFEIENMLLCEKLVKEVINYINNGSQDLIFQRVKQTIKNKFIQNKDVWIVRHVAFDLRDKFDYRGKINSLLSINDFKSIYNLERLSDDEIDERASKYNDLYNLILGSDDYNTYLIHLDWKNILNECNDVVCPDSESTYAILLFQFLETDKGKGVLTSIRTKYFGSIN